MPPVPARHFGGKPPASAAAIAAVQPLWQAVFSHWPLWVRAIRDAAASGALDGPLGRGVTSRASSLLPPRCPGVEQWSFGCVPHIQPQAQNDMIEAALGIEETNRFYASVMGLFER